MELRQIRSFLSIAETLHFGRTAEMIHLSQPALSLQIRALEDEIGARLFERNRRKTALTAAGIAFREEATGALYHSSVSRTECRSRILASQYSHNRSNTDAGGRISRYWIFSPSDR
jgi:DNA-binding transcriptional LysR family regulator